MSNRSSRITLTLAAAMLATATLAGRAEASLALPRSETIWFNATLADGAVLHGEAETNLLGTNFLKLFDLTVSAAPGLPGVTFDKLRSGVTNPTVDRLIFGASKNPNAFLVLQIANPLALGADPLLATMNRSYECFAATAALCAARTGGVREIVTAGAVTVPEPATAAVFGTGVLLTLAFARTRRRSRNG